MAIAKHVAAIVKARLSLTRPLTMAWLARGEVIEVDPVPDVVDLVDHVGAGVECETGGQGGDERPGVEPSIGPCVGAAQRDRHQ